MKKSKIVLPISGGIDSSVLLHKAIRQFDEVHCLSFLYNQRHDKELKCANEQAFHALGFDLIDTNWHTIDLTTFGQVLNSALTDHTKDVPHTKDVLGDGQPPTYVPFRNMLFLTMCCSYAESIGAKTVWHGAAEIDTHSGYWDGSNEFLNKINSLIHLNRKNIIDIEAPLINFSKKDIIKIGVELGVRFQDTWTCYKGQKLACGYCSACSSRIQGFLDNNIIDPLPYSRKDIPWKENFSTII